jgi:hypothetical protein
MKWTGSSAPSGTEPSDASRMISIAFDFPERGRPRRSDVGEHLTSHLGTAGRALRSAPGGPLPVDVNIVWPSAERPWISAYTVGASSRPMAVPPELLSQVSPYAEFMLRLPPTWVPETVCPLCSPPKSERDPIADARTAWPFEWLVRLAEQAHVEGSFIGPGHIVEDADGSPREDGLPFCGFYLEPGWDEAADRPIPPLLRGDGRRVDFLSVIPLLPNELRAFRDGRSAQVLRALDAAGVTDLLVPGRPSCV